MKEFDSYRFSKVNGVGDKYKVKKYIGKVEGGWQDESGYNYIVDTGLKKKKILTLTTKEIHDNYKKQITEKQIPLLGSKKVLESKTTKEELVGAHWELRKNKIESYGPYVGVFGFKGNESVKEPNINLLGEVLLRVKRVGFLVKSCDRLFLLPESQRFMLYYPEIRKEKVIRKFKLLGQVLEGLERVISLTDNRYNKVRYEKNLWKIYNIYIDLALVLFRKMILEFPYWKRKKLVTRSCIYLYINLLELRKLMKSFSQKEGSEELAIVNWDEYLYYVCIQKSYQKGLRNKQIAEGLVSLIDLLEFSRLDSNKLLNEKVKEFSFVNKVPEGWKLDIVTRKLNLENYFSRSNLLRKKKLLTENQEAARKQLAIVRKRKRK